MVSLDVKKISSLISLHLFIFKFYFHYSGRQIKKDIPAIYVRVCSASKSFIVSSLTVRYLIHFQLIFVYGVREHFNFILLKVAIQFPQHHLLKRLSFSLVYSCFFHDSLSEHRFMGLYLGFLSCTIGLYLCFCARIILF